MNTPDIKDKKEKHLDDISNPSVDGEIETQLCTVDDRGRFKKHNFFMKVIFVTSKKWVDKGKAK